jgi:hypothetical protein
MLVSILIANFNYGRYLGDAIDSALGQTYRDIEVVVVDDGSTDNSIDVMESYGARIASVTKKNGGLASALNAAFERSHGDLLCMLDADDIFMSEKVEEVVAASRNAPDAYMIHHQLQIVDEAGKRLHAPFPRHVPDGHLRRRVIRSGGWFPHAVMSGLSFRRSYAERLFPVPERHAVRADPDAPPVWPDTHLAGPAALLAPVAGIQAPLACYRVHGENLALGQNTADRLVQYEAEMRTLSDVMREQFGQPVELELDGHVDYQLLRCATREISRPRAAARLLRSPLLPVSLRIREALRLSINRGPAARRPG